MTRTFWIGAPIAALACIAIITTAYAQLSNYNSSRSNRSPSDGIANVPGTGNDLKLESQIDAKLKIEFPDGTVPDRKRFEQIVDYLLAQTKGDLMASFDSQQPKPARRP